MSWHWHCREEEQERFFAHACQCVAFSFRAPRRAAAARLLRSSCCRVLLARAIHTRWWSCRSEFSSNLQQTAPMRCRRHRRRLKTSPHSAHSTDHRAGKGTQCDLIVKDYGFVHFSGTPRVTDRRTLPLLTRLSTAGDLLRAEQNRESSQYGELIKDCIANGLIVPQEITIKVRKRALSAAPANKHGAAVYKACEILRTWGGPDRPLFVTGWVELSFAEEPGNTSCPVGDPRHQPPVRARGCRSPVATTLVLSERSATPPPPMPLSVPVLISRRSSSRTP